MRIRKTITATLTAVGIKLAASASLRNVQQRNTAAMALRAALLALARVHIMAG